MENLFDHKELIYTVYEEKNFSRAAQKLFISQPALSAMIKRIEGRIGMPLFDRTCKPIRLTEVGMRYISCVEQIRQSEGAFENYIIALNDLQTGSLSIGSNQLLSSLVLPRYISRFLQEHPKIKLSLLDANATALENAIRAGRLDIIIDNHVYPEDTFEKIYLTTEHLLLAVPAAFPQNDRARACQLTYQDILDGRHVQAAPVALDIFSQVPFILMNRDNDTRKQTHAIFQEAAFTPNVLFELDRLVTLYAYVEAGTAASVVSDTLIRNIRPLSGCDIVFYTLPTGHARRDICVSYKRNQYHSKAMATFIESLHNLR